MKNNKLKLRKISSTIFIGLIMMSYLLINSKAYAVSCQLKPSDSQRIQADVRAQFQEFLAQPNVLPATIPAQWVP